MKGRLRPAASDVAHFLAGRCTTPVACSAPPGSYPPTSPVTAEQLSQDILVQPCAGSGGVQVFRGGTAFPCPEPLVSIDRHHHGLTAKVKAYEVVLVVMPRRLCAHGLHRRGSSDIRDGHRAVVGDCAVESTSDQRRCLLGGSAHALSDASARRNSSVPGREDVKPGGPGRPRRCRGESRSARRGRRGRTRRRGRAVSDELGLRLGGGRTASSKRPAPPACGEASPVSPDAPRPSPASHRACGAPTGASRRGGG